MEWTWNHRRGLLSQDADSLRVPSLPFNCYQRLLAQDEAHGSGENRYPPRLWINLLEACTVSL